ncbi:HD-GYP domain-containing protein [Clostridium sp.]|uniref:HD-GYP domain-containing protein n=1 Tax=Clostridium sp. TaxID=1506 RepID=UPI002FCB9E06
MGVLPTRQKQFFIFTYIITLIFFLSSLYLGYIPVELRNYTDILFFAILTALTESFTVVYLEISFSTTFAITIASYILLGPFKATVILIFGVLFRILRLDDGTYNHFFNAPLYGTVFNCCVQILPIFIGNYFYIVSGGTFGAEKLSTNIISLIIFSGVYFLLNTFIMSIMLSFYINKNVLYCYFSNIKLGLLNYIAMIPFGIILAFVFNEYKYFGVLLMLCPIILARYTFSMYIDSKFQYIQTVEALMNTIEARDQYTQGHSRRVAEISTEIAKAFKYNQWKLEKLMVAAMLHDVGKIGISDNILNKPGKLTDDEFSKIKDHPEIGHNILKDVKNLEYIWPIVRHHHERYDGKGYPHGLKENNVSLDTYIVQLADAVDAMATDRPYRKGLTKEQIIKEIENNIGTQFHPKVADAYLNILKNAN